MQAGLSRLQKYRARDKALPNKTQPLQMGPTQEQFPLNKKPAKTYTKYELREKAFSNPGEKGHPKKPIQKSVTFQLNHTILLNFNDSPLGSIQVNDNKYD